MTKIDIDQKATLPGFHDRSPMRSEDNRFLNSLKRGSPIPQDNSFTNGQPSKDQRVRAISEEVSLAGKWVVGRVAMSEIYGFSSHALNKLSYIQSASQDAQLQEEVAAGIRAEVNDGSSIRVRHGMSVEVGTVFRQENAVQYSIYTDLLVAEGQVAVEVERKGAVAPFLDSSEAFKSKSSRNIRFFNCANGVEAVVRDYDIAGTEELVGQIILHCRENNIPLAHVLLNGNLVWSSQSDN